MKTIGYNRPVCIRPFDHHGSFQARMCRVKVASHVLPGFSGADVESHLMISNPDFFLEQFIETGSDSVLVHWEG